MENTEELVRNMLLSGRHINKVDMRNESEINYDCLPQRIKDIRYKTDWDIKHRSVPGRGTLREYWVEPEEIQRIKGNLKPFKEVKQEVEQLADNLEKAVEMPPKEVEKEEQLGLGFVWQK